IDDLAPLHQLTPQITASAVQLFHPRDGYRTRTGAEFLSPTVDYYLPTAPDGEVKIEILDATGKTVNSYSSNAAAPAGRGRPGGGGEEPADPDAAPGRFRGGVTSRVTKTAGLNRF